VTAVYLLAPFCHQQSHPLLEEGIYTQFTVLQPNIDEPVNGRKSEHIL
jgi:hypothetical protein